uniref:Mucin 1, cell surface-associated n=1 Tax=Neovison vison TaxID=452646 RepID=A0A8C7BNZ1_NEOVI
MTPGFQAPLFLLLLASLQLQASSSTTTPGQHSGTSPTQVPPGHGAITAASTTPRGPEPPAISVFSLSFSIENRHFNSSLEDPGSSYYQELQRNISELSGSGVPGWGIALLVLVCVLVALAIICVIALTVCQCRRKNCGQLDIFPARDAYHPMSEYPTYHTHGRYMPPGSRRSPYEEVRRGNGGFSSVNPSTSATSANL